MDYQKILKDIHQDFLFIGSIAGFQLIHMV